MFQIFAENIKIHWVNDQNTTNFVIKNLTRRYNVINPVVKETNENTFIWETAGTLIGNDIKFEFKLDEKLNLICRSQHWFNFKQQVYRQLSDTSKYDNVFYKLHGYCHVLCLTENQRNSLLLQISSTENINDAIAKEKENIIQSVNISLLDKPIYN